MIYRILLILAIAYLLICLSLFTWQNRFIFFPQEAIKNTPAQLKLKYEDVWLKYEQDVLHGWWIPQDDAQAKVVLYLHGNGSNISHHLQEVSLFHSLGLQVFLIDYRPYGYSKGNFPTEAQVYEDAKLGIDYLINYQKFPQEKIFLYGHSLGGAIAIESAQHYPELAGLIIEGSFTSIREIAGQNLIYNLFPLDLILHQRFDSLNKINKIEIPVLFIHGTADRVVEYKMSESLYKAANEPKKLLLIEGGGHNNIITVGGHKYLLTLKEFFR